MTRRRLKSWLTTYTNEYAAFTEAPKIMHFYAGVSAIAGALRKHVWVDQNYFRWTPCFYIVFVAKPGIVSKSTTADIAMDLLKDVPGIQFGPDIATWQSLPPAFTGACEAFEYNGEYHPMSPLTFASSELGNLLDFRNTDLINLFITLWDGKKTLSKITKMSGNDLIEAPWINVIGCTTPQWIAQNLSTLSVEGGFTSRCLFVYADRKEQLIAWPKSVTPTNIGTTRADLIHDLEYIATNLIGEYIATPEALVWMDKWYKATWTNRPAHLQSDHADGYIARRQTHLVKLAMVLAASEKDDLTLTELDFGLADRMLQDIELTFQRSFSHIGKSNDSLNFDRFIRFMERYKDIPYAEGYRMITSFMPDARDIEGIIASAVQARYVKLESRTTGICMVYTGEEV